MTTGDLETARSCLEQSLAIMSETDDRMNAAVMAMSLGSIYRLLGDDDRALELLAQSLESSAELGHLGNAAACMEGLAALALASERLDEAGLLVGGAELLRSSGVEALPMSDALNAGVADAVRGRLGADYDRFVAEAQAITIEEAIDRALATT